jgi:uridylate kinase
VPDAADAIARAALEAGGAAASPDAARGAAADAAPERPVTSAGGRVPPLTYQRVLVKLSGEALAGSRGFGFDFEVIEHFADEIKDAVDMGAEVGLVIGGGNIVRGSQLHQKGMDRVSADYMGMLGTVINALALQDILERRGMATRVMTAIRMEELAEPYIRRRALRHFEKKRIVIFAAGTGNPYFTTDTAAVLRAIQMKADVIIKATSVDGIYSADPKQHPQATRYEELSYRDVMRDELRVMDQTAFTLCKENELPLIVLNLNTPRAVSRAILGERIGTLVR